ncbi:MAG: hypothetical protein ACREQY_12145, partial [Candidatus Binatia bacterium]
MKRTLRILPRIALGLLAVVAVALGAAVAIARTDRFRDFLREQVVATANASVRGELSLGRIEGFILSHLSLHDVSIRYEGREVVAVPRVDLRYSIVRLVRGRLDV